MSRSRPSGLPRSGSPRSGSPPSGSPPSPVDCVLRAGATLGESPVWDGREGALYWVDIYAPALNRFDPSSGANQRWPMPAPIGCCALRAAGGLIVALGTELRRFDTCTGALDPFVGPIDPTAAMRFNDGRADPKGRMWVGTMREPPDPARRDAAFYKFEPDGAGTEMIGGHVITNGLAFSPDGRTLYHSDSHASAQTVWAWDFDAAAGTIANRRVFVDMHAMAGRPDGAAVDADGCYWTAANEGWQIIRFTPKGRVDRRVPVPVARPTMVAFGGPRLDTLFITSMRPLPGDADAGAQPLAGSIFAFAPGVTGVAEPFFAG